MTPKISIFTINVALMKVQIAISNLTKNKTEKPDGKPIFGRKGSDVSLSCRSKYHSSRSFCCFLRLRWSLNYSLRKLHNILHNTSLCPS